MKIRRFLKSLISIFSFRLSRAATVYGFYKNGMNLQGMVTTLIQQNPQAAKFLEQAQTMAKGKSPEQLEIFATNFARERNVPDWVLEMAKKKPWTRTEKLMAVAAAIDLIGILLGFLK